MQGSPAPGAPFGEGPRRALDRALEIAARMGFEPHSHEDYMGWFDLPGEREAHIATDRKSTRLNSSHSRASRMPSSA